MKIKSVVFRQMYRQTSSGIFQPVSYVKILKSLFGSQSTSGLVLRLLSRARIVGTVSLHVQSE